MPREEPGQFRMKDLFIDVKLEACVNGSTFDFLGRKLFSAEFYRQNIGFGITDIDIEINTSLQPLVTVTFKDLYGNTVFGSQARESSEDGQSIDFSVLFNWPPPKFLFSFKGYLGKPASWVLNLKKTTTSFNSSDGSYDLKCEFVPNQWGFFADMPFLYLLAAKRLRKDKLGNDVTEDQLRGITSVFDLIKIGKQVEVKTQDTTKEFDDLVKQLGSIKSNMARALVVTNILAQDEVINGNANNQSTKDFIKMTIPSLTTVRDKKNLGSPELIDQHLSIPQSLNALNAYFLLSIKFDTDGKNIDGFDRFSGMPTDFVKFRDAFNTGGSPENLAISTAKFQTLGFVSDNLEKVDDEIKRRVFSTSRTKLEKITIGNIFSQLAKDAAFVIGSILDAGLDGYLGDQARREDRDVLVEDGTLIGESFPLVILEGEEVPATDENLPGAKSIGVDVHEMDFVKRFINAISEGIAKDLLSGNEQNGEDDSKLKQRVNNMEMSSGNPYKSYYQNIAQNILIRGGIVAFFTRSDDPNLPGDFNTTFSGDRDDLQSIEEIAERDMQNVTDSIINNLSDVDFLLLKRFCTFFSRFITKDAEGIATASGKKGIDLSYTGVFEGAITSFLTGGISDLLNRNFNGDAVPGILDWKVVMSSPTPANLGVSAGDNNPLDFINFATNTQFAQAQALGVQTLNFQTIWNELYTPALLKDVEILGEGLVFSEIEDIESRREDQDIANNTVTGTTGGQVSNFKADFNPGKIRNAQTPLSFVNTTDFTATRIVNNSIAYAFPNAEFTQNDYFAVFFRGKDNKRAQEANTAPTDAEGKNEDKDETGLIGQTEVLGYIPVNSKYNDDKILGRITTLKEYRSGTRTSGGGNIFDFDECKDPSPGFYGIPGGSFGLNNLLWLNAILEDQNDSDDVTFQTNGTDYVGDVGYTVCAHSGSDEDSGLVFGLFNPSSSGRNHRAYVRKCAEVLERQIKEILDKRNQVIGEVLGKAGESEDLIYKQMHTLFHQWQTLSYSDKKDSFGSLCGNVEENKGGDSGDNGNVFNNAEALERRFGSNHHDLAVDEKICFSETQLIEEADFTSEQLAELEQIDGKLCLSLNNQTESSGVPDGTFIYDYPLQRISRPSGSNIVNVKDSIINLEPLYNPNGNTTVLNIIQQVCSKNNFLFIPIPGNPGYLDVKEIYTPSREPANLQIRNFFHVLFTPTPESRTKTRNNEGTPISLSENHRSYNANSFVIRYGHPDNQIVSNIQVGTDENKVTAESIINLQRLVDNENQNKKVTTDCSMLPVLAGRSYKASVDMLGNSQCYPMQFFYLENSPLFGGLYQIMKVKHTISPNDMKTSLEGIRMRFAGGNYGGIEPITLQTFIDLGKSEAPFALGEGFDKTDRENLVKFRNNVPSPGAVSRTANVTDYSGQGFVDGNKGGPVAQSVPTLSISQLNAYDTSLGVRELWADVRIIGSAQMYIVDGYPVKADVASAYIAMRDAAIADGINLKITSGYRDPFNDIIHPTTGKRLSQSQYSLRVQNVRNKSKKNDDDFLRKASSSEFDPATARPGGSNHNSGIAIDLNCYGRDLASAFNQVIYEWLMLNAHRFGFVRTINDRKGRGEEWHWEYKPGSAMFQFVFRDDTLWYGLPDKLGIPNTNAEIDDAANAPTTVPATVPS